MLINNPKKDLIFTDLVDVKTFVNDQECVLLETNKIKGLEDFSVSLVDTFNGFLVIFGDFAKEFKSYEEACEFMYDNILDSELNNL